MAGGYAFDLEGLLGKACLLNVIHVQKGENTYANIVGSSQLPKGMEAPALFNETKAIDVDTASFAEIEALPDFIKDKMKSSEVYLGHVRHSANMEEAGLGQSATPGPTGKLTRPNILGGGTATEIGADGIPF